MHQTVIFFHQAKLFILHDHISKLKSDFRSVMEGDLKKTYLNSTHFLSSFRRQSSFGVFVFLFF